MTQTQTEAVRQLIDEIDQTASDAIRGEHSRFRSLQLTRIRSLAEQLRQVLPALPEADGADVLRRDARRETADQLHG